MSDKEEKKPANKSYGQRQDDLVKNLVDNHSFEKVGKHVIFDASKIELPETVTPESIDTHINLFNSLSGAAEVATAQIGRDLYSEDKKINDVTGGLNLGSLSISTEHSLKREIGEEAYYGISTTAVDYVHTEEATEWLAKQRDNNISLASKLFD